jgi:hypothetical protein
MFPLWTTVPDLISGKGEIRRWWHGVIEVADEWLVGVHLRAWPPVTSLPEVWLGNWHHASTPGNRCWLYYSTPLGFPNYLALHYMVSSRDTTLASCRRALRTLDEIARIRGTDALLSEASNLRISDRLLTRWGWERHCLDLPQRHYIKRFYGNYPSEQLQTEESQPVAVGG